MLDSWQFSMVLTGSLDFLYVDHHVPFYLPGTTPGHSPLKYPSMDSCHCRSKQLQVMEIMYDHLIPYGHHIDGNPHMI